MKLIAAGYGLARTERNQLQGPPVKDYSEPGMPTPYRQQLPELGLSLERATDRVPDIRGWFIFRGDELVGRYSSETKAREAWKALLDELGWRPVKREVDPVEAMRREQRERWARNRAG
jgi:hypothetical protein